MDSVSARPTKWGNPFDWKGIEQPTPQLKRAWAVKNYKDWLDGKYSPFLEDERINLLNSISELTGKDLACWCPENEYCHADVLLNLANKAN